MEASLVKEESMVCQLKEAREETVALQSEVAQAQQERRRIELEAQQRLSGRGWGSKRFKPCWPVSLRLLTMKRMYLKSMS